MPSTRKVPRKCLQTPLCLAERMTMSRLQENRMHLGRSSCIRRLGPAPIQAGTNSYIYCGAQNKPLIVALSKQEINIHDSDNSSEEGEHQKRAVNNKNSYLNKTIDKWKP